MKTPNKTSTITRVSAAYAYSTPNNLMTADKTSHPRANRAAPFYRKVGGLHFFRFGRFTFMACKGRRG